MALSITDLRWKLSPDHSISVLPLVRGDHHGDAQTRCFRQGRGEIEVSSKSAIEIFLRQKLLHFSILASFEFESGLMEALGCRLFSVPAGAPCDRSAWDGPPPTLVFALTVAAAVAASAAGGRAVVPSKTNLTEKQLAT